MEEPTTPQIDSAPASPSSSSPIPRRRQQQQANEEQQQQALPLTSYDSALALVPPRPLWPPIDRLRALYDRAYPRWPPHVNLVYPFVRPEQLDEAVGRVGAALSLSSSSSSSYAQKKQIPVRLARTGVFERKGGRDNTIYLSACCRASSGTLPS
ncbi:hypothetical protein VTH06DRAFT_2009 [Thermothelomyces fergusii]